MEELEKNIQEYKNNNDVIRETLKKQGLTMTPKLLEELSKFESNDYKMTTRPELYPNVQDPLFNLKLYLKKEFRDTKYPKLPDKSSKELSTTMCDSQDFELAPHQIFVRNFLSNFTPYNGLLLYHGLGSGKTCSAIGVSEEYRKYIQQLGNNKKIIVIASPNIQDNFKLQLFNKDKLVYNNGYYNLNACTGNSLIQEINPTNIRNLNKEDLSKHINKLIKQYYTFMGYTQFANLVDELVEKNKNMKRENIIREYFSDRLIIIDEVHNIRDELDDNDKIKRVLENLTDVSRYTRNLKLLLLSATPMFNTSSEILWILNLLRMNDGYTNIKYNEIFDKQGGLLIDDDGTQIGRDRLIEYSRGYISFIQGENPYSFPYRIFPSLFEKENTISSIDYPKTQLNDDTILEPIKYIDVYLTTMGSIQSKIYKTMEENTKGMGYQDLEKPLQALNIVYPAHKEQVGGVQELKPAYTLEDVLNISSKKQVGGGIEEQVGLDGLKNIMNFSNGKNFEYKEGVPHIFSEDELLNYSGKLTTIINKIKNSEGICLVYSQYIYSGCVPLALALEQQGFIRHPNGGGKSLFKEKYKPITLSSKNGKSYQPKYIMITGNQGLSPNNSREINLATSENNINGENVKVIIISRSGSEGIDLKNIRQAHIMEPWYNMNRIEQVIGRAIRFCSHKNLPFEKRNCEIYLYGTKPEGDKEPVDLYLYRISERKSIKIGEVSRVLKENAVDCLLNRSANQFELGETVKINISSRLEPIDYRVGNKPFSSLCDYMDSCSYQCVPELPINEIDRIEPRKDTYQNQHMSMNIDKLIMRIKRLFINNYVYDKDKLIGLIMSKYQYPRIKIIYAINKFLNKQELLIDQYNRTGYLIETKHYYIFQPIELHTHTIPMIERKQPILYKLNNIHLNTSDTQFKYQQKDIPIKTTKKVVMQKLDGASIFKTYAAQFKKIFDRKIEITNSDTINYELMSMSNIKNYFGDDITDEILNRLYIHRLYDATEPHHKMELITFLLKKDLFEEGKETNISEKNMFGRKMIKYLTSYIRNDIIINIEDGKRCIPFVKYESSKLKLVFKVITNDNNLRDIEESERLLLNEKLKEVYKIDDTKYNRYIGIIYYLKTKNELVFKIKDFTMKRRNDGANCSHKHMNDIKQIIDSIINNNYPIKEEIVKPQYCYELEMILRYFQYINKNDKIWFLNIEKAVYNNISNIRISERFTTN